MVVKLIKTEKLSYRWNKLVAGKPCNRATHPAVSRSVEIW